MGEKRVFKGMLKSEVLYPAENADGTAPAYGGRLRERVIMSLQAVISPVQTRQGDVFASGWPVFRGRWRVKGAN